MRKVLIAEDEALEKKALRFLLDKLFRDSIQIAGEASNGRDAIRQALEKQPDIVLMDINMPIVNGLEAGERIKEKRPDTEIIILTAFNYFSYMREAIHLEVADYLLKPYTDAEFTASIQRAMNRIEQKERHKSRMVEISRLYEQTTPFIEKEMVTGIVYGMRMTEEKYGEYRKILGISGNRFACLIARPSPVSAGPAMVPGLKKRLGGFFAKVIGNVCLNDIVLFVFDDQLDEKILSGRFGRLRRSIQNGDGTPQGLPLNLGLGCANESSDGLYRTYSQAKLELDRQNTRTDRPARESPRKKADAAALRMVKQLSAEILNENLEGAFACCDSVLDSLLQKNGSRLTPSLVQTYTRMMEKIVGNIIEFMGDGRKTQAHEIMGDVPEFTALPDMQLYAHMVLKELVRRISAYKKSSQIAIVEKAKKYIAENYRKDIRLEAIAEHVSLSSYYLSRVFNKVEGIHLKDYLIKVRMEKAKNLLRQGNATIKQVSIDVGYPDPNYFSRAFKKYTQLSPKEYINF